MKILILDDEITVSRAIGFSLQKKGHSVIEVHHPLDALRKIEQENFDFFVFDVNLSLLSGSDILKIIHNKNNSIPVIIITSQDIESINNSEFLIENKYTIISKEQSIIEITNEIESVINNYQ